jgi:hypothetical protein
MDSELRPHAANEGSVVGRPSGAKHLLGIGPGFVA